MLRKTVTINDNLYNMLISSKITEKYSSFSELFSTSLELLIEKNKKEQYKEAMIEALTHLEGCKYFVATIVNEEERRFDMSLRMSQHQLALIIKGILSNNEMMMMDVLQWCSERFKNSIEKGKKSTN